MLDCDNKLVNCFMSTKGYIAIDPPVWSLDFECPFCGEKTFFLFMVDKERRAWVCGRVCAGSKLPSGSGDTSTLPDVKRSILWHEFCELNGIGDQHHDVQFENIQQSQGKIDYMLKFVNAPCGIIFMKGTPGTGKTYAAMAMCELFTRRSSSCIFTTQEEMEKNWLISINDHLGIYANTIKSTSLLVVDDFGTGEPNPKFLKFFMSVINTRLQWKSRGTIITTNLNDGKFSLFCGDALSDRIATGQVFSFEGKTKRKKTVL